MNLELTEQEARMILRGLRACQTEHDKASNRTSQPGLKAHEAQIAGKFSRLAERFDEAIKLNA